MKILVKCMHGIGDTIYSRPFVKMLVDDGHEDKFILTGRQGDIKLPFSDPRLTAKEWLDFANEHGWKKTNTKFALVDKE